MRRSGDAQAVLDTDPERWYSHKHIIDALVALGVFRTPKPAREIWFGLPPPSRMRCSSHHGSTCPQDRLEQALELVDKVLDIDAGHQRARHLRGLILIKMGTIPSERGVARSSRPIIRAPNPPTVAVCSLLLSGEWEEAIDAAAHVIEIDPERTGAHYVRGRALIELGRPADAVADFDNLLITNDCQLLLIAASCVRRIDDYGAARRYLDRVAELQPDNRELWIERTLLHIDEGTFDAAAESAARLAALPGGSLLGRLLAAQAAAAAEPLRWRSTSSGPTSDVKNSRATNRCTAMPSWES